MRPGRVSGPRSKEISPVAGSFLLTDKTSADIGPGMVDGTFALGQKLAAVFDNQLMVSGQRKVKAVGAKGFEPFKLGPGNF